MTPRVLERHALACAAHGWPVLPCEPRGKRPLTQRGCLDATTDAATVQAWWARWPSANVGVACGAVAGVLVLDVDGEAGRASLARLGCPVTPRVTTGSGGVHLYLRHVPGARNRVRCAPGLDVRTDGGYVVAPPSVHATGGRYVWDVRPRDVPLADAPAWLVEACTAPLLAAVPPPVDYAPRADTWDRARRYLARMDPSIAGSGGHVALLRAAVALVRGFELGAEDAYALLAREFSPRCEPPWSERDLRRKVAEAARVGAMPFGELARRERRGA